MKISFVALIVALLCEVASANAQTLSAGDIAVVGYNYDDPDQLKLVALTNIPAGTQFNITDNGWNGTSLSTSEGLYSYTAANAISAGTVFNVNTSGMALSTTGDQVILYQGLTTAPSCIFAMSTTPWVTTSVGKTTSRLPPGLTNGVNAISFTVKKDDGKYTVTSNSGNKVSLLSKICSQANWYLTTTRISMFPAWSFNLTALAAEPDNNPGALSFTNVRSYLFNLSFTATSGSVGGYLVLRRQGSVPTGLPTDGVGYKQGDYIGDGQVAYVGTATGFTQKTVVANTVYGYNIFAYNGTDTTINYKQTAPLTGSVTSSGNGMGAYYDAVSTVDTAFVTKLENRIRTPYVKIAYDQYDETMMANFAYRDAPAGQRTVTCAYTGFQYTYAPPFVWYTASPFSREHTWCHSWMPTYTSTSGNEYSDQHHLFPVNQTQANAPRSNHPLGKVVTVLSSYLDGKLGYDSLGHQVYEPRDAQKGNSARALLYMTLRYNGVNGFDWTFNHLNNVILPALSEFAQNINVLLQWNAQDPPDNDEIARNDYIETLQQNRNPFVDHPEYVSYINFNALTYTPSAPRYDVAPPSRASFEAFVYPIPSAGDVHLDLNSEPNQSVTMEWFDLRGILVKKFTAPSSARIETTASELPTGLYMLVINCDGNVAVTRWVKL